MKLETINFIDQSMERIRAILLEEDAYYINDTIINNLTDPELPALVIDMMKANDYSEEKMQEVLDIINAIQDKVLEEDDEA